MARFEITSGAVPHALKIIVYGPEGVGKSTFASQFPDPLFIDTEGSTKGMDVKRYPAPTSWPMLLDEVHDVGASKPCCTLVIDTADWAEKLCITNVCNSHGWSGIEDPGYGNGYRYVFESFGKLINELEFVVNQGINVVLNCHSIIKKFEQPDEMGSYDRYQLKLIDTPKTSIANMVKEWADIVLFANYQTVVVQTKDKKSKGQGGQRRVMYTQHTATWDAKNRHNLPMSLDFEFKNIEHLFPKEVKQEQVQVQQELIANDKLAFGQQQSGISLTDGMDQPGPRFVEPEDITRDEQRAQQQDVYATEAYKGIPDNLMDLMRTNRVTEDIIREAVARRGYFPKDMPIGQYPADFIQGVLVGAWDQVIESVNDLILPF